jgi:type II secretion system protein N
MSRIIKALYLVTVTILFIILTWMIVIPDDLISSGIEDTISDSLEGRLGISISGLTKTPLFVIHINTIMITMDGQELIEIRRVTSRLKPLSLLRKKLHFSVNGRIGRGTIAGYLTLPLFTQTGHTGILNISRIELNSIPYLKNIDFEGDGHLSAVIHLNERNTLIKFNLSDLNITNLGILTFPLVETFHDIQGAITIHGKRIEIRSLGLKGEKGYARLKGYINGDKLNLTLELMPYPDKLTQVENMLINKYQVSPGYYEIPIKGRI